MPPKPVFSPDLASTQLNPTIRANPFLSSTAPVQPLPTIDRPNSVQPTRVILLRHGRSTFNDQGRYQGSSDEAILTEQGRNTARQTAEVFKNLAIDAIIDAIYVSPLKRAQETLAELLAVSGDSFHSKPIVICDRLREIDLPLWEGLSFQQVRQQFRAQYECWKQLPHEFCMECPVTTDRSVQRQHFPVLSLYQRAHQFWQAFLPAHQGQTALIISHGGTNHALISTALGLPATQHHTIQQSNCGISLLEFTPSQVRVEAINLTDHLGEALPKLKEGKQGLRLILTAAAQSRTAIDRVTQLLQSVSLNFILTTHPLLPQTAELCRNHPQAIQIQVDRIDAQAWPQSLTYKRTSAADLLTGLVIADASTVQTFLEQAIQLRQGVNPETIVNSPFRAESLQIQAGALSVLHYPAIDHPAILQALNFGQDLRAIFSK